MSWDFTSLRLVVICANLKSVSFVSSCNKKCYRISNQKVCLYVIAKLNSGSNHHVFCLLQSLLVILSSVIEMGREQGVSKKGISREREAKKKTEINVHVKETREWDVKTDLKRHVWQ